MLKKIFHGFNLMGNRIKNAKVDLPTDNEHIVNKQYSDSQQIYDTQATQLLSQSPKFSWIKSLQGKTLKEVLDMLIYPNVLPDYKNPTIAITNFKCNAQYENYIQKFIAFYKTPFTATFNIEVDNPDDREAISATVLAVQNGASTASFNADSIELNSIINATFEITPETKIFLRRHFGPAITIKKDTYGNNYVPDDFKISYDAEVEITDLVLNQYSKIFNPIWTKAIDESALPIHQHNDVKTTDEILALGYLKTADLIFTANADAVYSMLIPENLYDDYLISNIVYKDTIVSKTNKVEILKEWLSGGEKSTMTIDGLPYVICHFNFGYFTEQLNSKLFFNKII